MYYILDAIYCLNTLDPKCYIPLKHARSKLLLTQNTYIYHLRREIILLFFLMPFQAT
jgi:hypothetical protein